MSAADSYWEAIELGRLPIALVIETEEGVRGIATVVFGAEVTASSDVSNPDKNIMERCKSICRATLIAKKRVESEFEGVTVGPGAY